MPVTDPFFLPYPQSYYSKHARGSMLEETRGVGRAIGELLQPKSVLDVGCGVGAMLEGIRDVCPSATLQGIDAPHAIDIVRSSGLNRVPMKWLTPFDLRRFKDGEYPRAITAHVVVSTEVAEHIPNDVSPEYVAYLCENPKYVVFTAAHPGQGGEGHINERDIGFWDDLFDEVGFRQDAHRTNGLRAKLVDVIRGSWWYRPIFVYVRRT